MAVRFDTRCDGVAALLRWCRFCAIGNGADDVGGRNAHHACCRLVSVGSRDVGVGKGVGWVSGCFTTWPEKCT